MDNAISSEFPFESQFIDINGSQMHYIDEGKGDPILFLHGNPTSSYLWRNVIPHLANKGRCIAPDLIGMGKSGKPDIGYTFFDHYDYLNAFIEKLDLKNITLIIHDWGSALGFYYAFKHPNNIKGIAFMEAVFKTVKWNTVPKTMKRHFKMMRLPIIGWLLTSVGNVFIKKLLPGTIIRQLSKAELKVYEAPYLTIKSRKPLQVWPTQIPFDGKPQNVHQAVSNYHNWLKESAIPKLCLYATPGLLIRKNDVAWIAEKFKNTTIKDVGKGIHFIQEDNPHGIGKALSEWVDGIN
ncbi:MAG: haloalkane dehalogenase [Flavobacteriales bacterium]|jgi:haloalkane dehalogenase|nr:haloalkane dehalogenase [Flavobacteriales bacterium]